MDLSSIIENLTLNIITEVLGIIITVFFVDRIIKRNDNRRWKPVKSVLFAEVFRSIQDILYQMPIDFVTTSRGGYLFGNSSVSSRVEIIEPFPLLDPLTQALEQSIQHTNKLNVKGLLFAYRHINSVVGNRDFMLPPELLELILKLNNAFRILERLHNDEIEASDYDKKKLIAAFVSRIMNTSYEINKWLVKQADEHIDDMGSYIKALISNAQKVESARNKKG